MTVGQQAKFDRVMQAASRAAQMDIDAILGKGRTRLVADVRMATMYCLVRYLGVPLPEVGRLMYRDHSTVCHAVADVTGKIDKSCCPAMMQDVVDAVRKELGIEQK